MEDKLKTLQTTFGGDGTELTLIVDISTRWISVFAMLQQFFQVRTCLTMLYHDLVDFNWEVLSEIVEILKPLADLTSDLQQNSANAETVVNVLNYLMSYSDFKKQSKPDNGFDIMAAITNFKPASIDPERLLSCGPISKNYMQN